MQQTRLSISKRYSEKCPYLELDLLGKGASASVYKVIREGKQYALKRIQIYELRNSQQAKALEQQIFIMKNINHPNIVKLYQVYETDNSLELMMQYMPRGNMFNKLKQFERIPQNMAKKYLRDVLNAVQYLHSFPNPIIHRDIKPENLLLDQYDNVKICDFGSAGLIIGKKQRQSYVGTPDYMAPQMVEHTGHKQSLDIWCLGMLLYELLTGKVANNPPVFPDYISRPAQDLIKKMMIQRPQQRPNIIEIRSHIWFVEQDYSTKMQRLSNKKQAEPISSMLQRIKRRKQLKTKKLDRKSCSLIEESCYPTNSMLSIKSEQVGDQYIRKIQKIANLRSLKRQNDKKIETMKKLVKDKQKSEQSTRQTLKSQIKSCQIKTQQKKQQLQRIKSHNPLYVQYSKLFVCLNQIQSSLHNIPNKFKNQILSVPQSNQPQIVQRPLSDYIFKWKLQMLQAQRNALIQLKMILKRHRDHRELTYYEEHNQQNITNMTQISTHNLLNM